MTCADIQKRIASYWDDLDESARLEVDRHLETCADCKAEFDFWRESMEMMREVSMPQEELPEWGSREKPLDLSQAVMHRIYSDDRWRQPLSEKIYSFANPLRRKVTGLIAFFVSLFLFSVLFSLSSGEAGTAVVYGSMLEVASASVVPMAGVKDGGGSGINVARVVMDPAMVRMGPLDYSTNYLLVLSLLGLISSLIILNWFMRIRR